MSSGLWFCFLATLSFGFLGCVSKFAERRNCRASRLVVCVYLWASLVMLVRSAGLPSPLSLSLKAVLVSVACGFCGAVAYYAFQSSIEIGKVSVGWLLMNVSSAIPAIVSVFLYKERITLLKTAALVLVVIALVLIFKGREAEEATTERAITAKQYRRWVLLMVVVLLFNGMSAFGLKVIAAWGLPEAARYTYLTVWYASGLLVIGVPTVIKEGFSFRSREAGWGGLMAGLSMTGQVAMAAALKLGVPGHMVFPIAIGGSTFVVILGGRLLFGERMNKLTASGVYFGLASVVLLGVS